MLLARFSAQGIGLVRGGTRCALRARRPFLRECAPPAALARPSLDPAGTCCEPVVCPARPGFEVAATTFLFDLSQRSGASGDDLAGIAILISPRRVLQAS